MLRDSRYLSLRAENIHDEKQELYHSENIRVTQPSERTPLQALVNVAGELITPRKLQDLLDSRDVKILLPDPATLHSTPRHMGLQTVSHTKVHSLALRIHTGAQSPLMSSFTSLSTGTSSPEGSLSLSVGTYSDSSTKYGLPTPVSAGGSPPAADNLPHRRGARIARSPPASGGTRRSNKPPTVGAHNNVPYTQENLVFILLMYWRIQHKQMVWEEGVDAYNATFPPVSGAALKTDDGLTSALYRLMKVVRRDRDGNLLRDHDGTYIMKQNRIRDRKNADPDGLYFALMWNPIERYCEALSGLSKRFEDGYSWVPADVRALAAKIWLAREGATDDEKNLDGAYEFMQAKNDLRKLEVRYLDIAAPSGTEVVKPEKGTPALRTTRKDTQKSRKLSEVLIEYRRNIGYPPYKGTRPAEGCQPSDRYEEWGPSDVAAGVTPPPHRHMPYKEKAVLSAEERALLSPKPINLGSRWSEANMLSEAGSPADVMEVDVV